MATNATVSTPIRPAMKSRTIDTASPMTTGTVPAAQIRPARTSRPANQAIVPRTNPVSAIASSALRRFRSVISFPMRSPYFGGQRNVEARSADPRRGTGPPLIQLQRYLQGQPHGWLPTQQEIARAFFSLTPCPFC